MRTSAMPGRPYMISRRTFVISNAIGAKILYAYQAPTKSAEVASLSIESASALLRAKTLSPLDLTRACLSEIERLNPRLNAFITVAADSALAAAREMETEITRGVWRGPLHGIPFAAKDNIETAGIRTTAASAVLGDNIPTRDAESVRRLKQAGAILLGKLNIHEFAYGGTSVISHYGPVRNPWNPAYIAGGSSGGSGCATAARMCYFALGTDSGGSVRQPAAYCGVVGLQPTYGLVSTRGIIAGEWSTDHIGPITRTIADCTLALQALAGYNPDDPYSANHPVPRFSNFGDARKLRIGIPRRQFYTDLHPEIAATAEGAITLFNRISGGTRDIDMPPAEPMLRALEAEGYSFHEPQLRNHPELYHPSTRGRINNRANVTAAEYLRAREELVMLRRRVVEVFGSCDVLVTPTLVEEPRTVVDVQTKGGGVSIRNTVPFSYYSLPTVSIPCGFTKAGIPIGIQVSGPPWGEQAVFTMARAYEDATDWHKRKPAAIGP